MDNEVVKFTCFRSQIPSYFTKLNRLDEIDKASKELKSAKQLAMNPIPDLAPNEEKQEQSTLRK